MSPCRIDLALRDYVRHGGYEGGHGARDGLDGTRISSLDNRKKKSAAPFRYGGFIMYGIFPQV